MSVKDIKLYHMKTDILPNPNSPKIVYDHDCVWALKYSGMFPVKVVRNDSLLDLANSPEIPGKVAVC